MILTVINVFCGFLSQEGLVGYLILYHSRIGISSYMYNIYIYSVYIYILYIHIYIKCVRTISCQNMFYRLSMLLQVHTEPLSLLWDGFSYLRNFS